MEREWRIGERGGEGRKEEMRKEDSIGEERRDGETGGKEKRSGKDKIEEESKKE